MKATTIRHTLFRNITFSYLLALFSVLVFSPIISVSATDNTCSKGFRQNLLVDGVNIDICIPFEADYAISPLNDELLQSASVTHQTPFSQFLIYAVPYGLTIGSSVADVAEPGVSASYLQKVRGLLDQQSARVLSAPLISIFGQSVPGMLGVRTLSSAGGDSSSQVNAVWVLEAGNRLWILQYIAQGDYSSPESLNRVLSQLAGVVVNATDFEIPSVSLNLAANAAPPDLNPPPAVRMLSDLPFPTWWSGDCNVNNHPGSYALGGVYRGLKACGPLNTLVLVNFGVGNRQYEWQCAEMSKRYLYIAFGIPPYSANGKDIVNNCPAHPQLEKVTNGTPNKGPNAGDVLSYNGSDPYGHTSIVSASNIDASGNGTIVIVEQNSSATGTRSHPVVNWVVQSGSGVSGWLHIINCSGADCIPVTYLPTVETNTIFPTYTWSMVTGATGYTLAIFDKFTGLNIYKKLITTADCSSTSNQCTFTPNKALTIGRNYKWKVSSTSGSGVSAFSPWRPFTVK